jgi:hypothetical protein
MLPDGKELARRLRRGKLPQMVDWFDPLVLGLVGMRTLISTTIGEYADQRPMQQIMDGDEGELLTRRHDYSKLNIAGDAVIAPESDKDNPRCEPRYDPNSPAYLPDLQLRQLPLDTHKALWVDFISDLGDGLEATYGMAYQLACENLQVRGTSRSEIRTLPAGQILIFGGDLAYPNSTLEEYRARCVDPYNWAFTANQAQPKRELFFIAGNHDWYDGLSAFTHQFCYESETIGGWRCTQRRSYFALKLPYNWWIWGIDVALGDGLDASQVDYFKAITRDMKKAKVADAGADPKIIIILHAPDWTKGSYRALERICEEARQTGEVCAILAGDLHHYSRYRSFGPKVPGGKEPRRDPPLDLIVSGGGGAFAHSTHDLKTHLKVHAAVAGRTLLDKDRISSVEIAAEQEPDYDFKAQKFYPSRLRTRVLALKNLWLPLHNRRFAALMGLIYLFYAWVFATSVPAQFQTAPADSILDLHVAGAAAVAATARASPGFFFLLLGLWAGLILYVDAKLEHPLWRWLNGPTRVVLGTAHFLFHLWALLLVSAVAAFLAAKLFEPAVAVGLLNVKIFFGEIWQESPFASAAAERVLNGMQACAGRLEWSGSAKAWACVQGYVGGDALFITLTTLITAASSIVIGGIIGAFVFGCYWAVTSALLGMHQDAFSALGIKDYKNFLRLKFEEGQLTIYPIAIDRIPRAREWRAWNPKKDGGLAHRPLLVTDTDMKPRLIEAPIIIKKGAPPILARYSMKGQQESPPAA